MQNETEKTNVSATSAEQKLSTEDFLREAELWQKVNPTIIKGER